MSWKTSTIDHDARIRMGLSMNDYVLLDYIYRTQTHPDYGGRIGGWCETTLDTMSEFFGISKGGLSGIIKKLAADGFIELLGNKRRTTWKWFSQYRTGVQKVNSCSESEQICSESEQDTILYKDKYKENTTPPVVGEPHPPQKPSTSLKEKKARNAEGRAGAENEPKELATVFDNARKELLKVGGLDWKQAKEHKNLKELVAALGRKGPEGFIYDLPAKKKYLRKFLEIASSDDFVKKNFTPSILYSMMNKIFTEYELKKQEAEKVEDLPYHKKFNHEPSGIATQLAAKKRI